MFTESGIVLNFRPVPGVKIETDTNKKASILVKDIQKNVLDCKRFVEAVTGEVAKIEDKVKLVEKKVKGLEKDKSRKLPWSEELTKLMSELVEMKKKKKKQKKKRKRRRSEKEPKQQKKKRSEKSPNK